MIPLLDILQSIPVLSFLPGVMLAMVALFPTRQLGLELGSILLIFTGQVWNMAFSFYSSLKAIPRELREAAASLPLQPLAALLQLELPFATIGLVWNSMVSVPRAGSSSWSARCSSSEQATSVSPASAPICKPPPATETPGPSSGASPP